jgi:hypothetical protein
MRIALFTPFSPEIGGGSVQLRSHIAQMAGLDIAWNYLAEEAVPGDRRRWLGKPLPPSEFAADIFARTGFLPGSTASVRALVKEMDADLYWVVAHYEGISVAAELLAQGKTVHLTVHDEPLAMIIRSRRFWGLYPLIGPLFKKVLLGAKSVDVTSWGMRDLFNHEFGLNCFALYRSLSELPHVKFAPEPAVLRVGHIGSLYHPEPFRQFVKACLGYAAEQKRALKILRIGESSNMNKVSEEYPELFESLGDLEESAAIPILANCDFFYAMYPDGFRYKGFRRTSLPIKLSTYIQAQRPIFAHTPDDSNMAKVVRKYGVGTVCTSQEEMELRRSIREFMSLGIGWKQFEAARSDLMGKAQVEQLRMALSESPAT